MRIRHIAAAGAALMLIVGLAGCAADAGGSDSESVVGTWGSTDQGQPHLVFADDGTLSGSDGCNRLMGPWTQDGNKVEFGAIASTMMACEGVDTWLNQASEATIEGSTLRIVDSSGAEIGALDRE